MMLLVPADVLRPRRADGHFAAEAEAARASGMQVALVDHDALTRPGGARQAVGRVPAGGEAIYRGWMLRSEQYAAFAAALRGGGLMAAAGWWERTRTRRRRRRLPNPI